jgi:hypothetical protein
MELDKYFNMIYQQQINKLTKEMFDTYNREFLNHISNGNIIAKRDLLFKTPPQKNLEFNNEERLDEAR